MTNCRRPPPQLGLISGRARGGIFDRELISCDKPHAHVWRSQVGNGRYAGSVAQALKDAVKVPIVRLRALQCSVPYALEGRLRREIEEAGASLQNVQHGAQVEFSIDVPEPSATALVARLNEVGQGRLAWYADA